MRASLQTADTEAIAVQLVTAPGYASAQALSEEFRAANYDIVIAILDEASKFATRWLEPLNNRMDAEGCVVIDGRVHTAPGHKESWTAFVANGWSTLDHPADEGGQALPSALAAAVQELFDRSCPAFGMLAVPQRAAARLIRAHGDTEMRAQWLPRLVDGSWGATICISEPDAGSDAGRIRTVAQPSFDGSWSITGEKVWISFGDHDLTPRIAHCLLARTPGSEPGGGGLSLFLVPDMLDGGGRNSVTVRRIEKKMGLHGSPTCALGFEGAKGWMIGTEGRGLAQMFVMITNMRLSVGVMGLGIGSAAAETALSYAAHRLQGGPSQMPLAIDCHPDVQRMLLDMAARVNCLRGLIYATANHADIATHSSDADLSTRAGDLVQWLLPIVKTTGGEFGFDNGSDAIQVLGGAGYTREWPVEQALRDARVLTIFEGTTGIQALDLTRRRLLRGDRKGYRAFLAVARHAAAGCPAVERACFDHALDIFERASTALTRADPRDVDAGSTAYLHLAALMATGWIAAHNAAIEGAGPTKQKLVASGLYWLRGIDDRAALLAAQACAGAGALDYFPAIRSAIL